MSTQRFWGGKGQRLLLRVRFLKRFYIDMVLRYFLLSARSFLNSQPDFCSVQGSAPSNILTMENLPKPLLEAVKELEEQFTVSTETLKAVSDHFASELTKGTFS